MWVEIAAQVATKVGKLQWKEQPGSRWCSQDAGVWTNAYYVSLRSSQSSVNMGGIGLWGIFLWVRPHRQNESMLYVHFPACIPLTSLGKLMMVTYKDSDDIVTKLSYQILIKSSTGECFWLIKLLKIWWKYLTEWWQANDKDLNNEWYRVPILKTCLYFTGRLWVLPYMSWHIPRSDPNGW